MKKLILFVILNFGINTAFADCSSNGMQFLPSSRNISKNSLFLIQGYYYSQQTILSFEKRNVYLESENGKKINLKLIEILKGQMSLTQAIFKPESELEPNTKYFLKYSNETKSEISERKKWNSESKKNEEIYWETNDSKNVDLLNSNLKINFEKTNVIQYGCGPSANAEFKIEISNNNEIWYKTEVIEISSGLKTVFYLTSYENKINVGHGVCSGAFTFKNNGKYKVRFTPTNSDGMQLQITKWTEFESPFANDKLGN
ncbi:hypothetical protein [Flavobacterium sp.]|uniref:hypothetical protein n=1 Tax=Flavobacterium sp. TaxID=239 RepID=UPI003753A0B8